MSLVTSLQDALLNRLFGSGGVVRIGNGADCYVGVCFTNPGDTGSTSNEANYGGRKQILSSEWTAASSGQLSNSGFLSVWIVTGTATLQYFLLGDTSTVNSTHDFSTTLTASVPVVLNDQIRFGLNTIVVQVDGLLTHTYANDQLDMLLRNLSPAPATDYYYALSTTTPSADGTGFTEPVGGNYGRVQKSRGGPFGSAVSGLPGDPSTITNTNDLILWPLPTASWGTVTYWGAFDAATGGNLLLYGALDAAAAVPTAFQPSFETGDLTLTMQ
jgi:hypothetical protein